MLKASGRWPAATLLSRVLGLVREQASMRASWATTWVAMTRFTFAFHDSEPVPAAAGRRRADGGVHPHFQAKGKNAR
jgi:hypothetical protein